MKITFAQSLFQVFLALSLFGITVQIRIPLVASTGNGKRSQPRSSDFKPDRLDRQIRVPSITSTGNGKKISSDSYEYDTNRINRQIRMPLVAATGNGKRSQSRSNINGPGMSEDWFYNPLNDEEGVGMLRNGNKPDLSSKWGLENLPTWSGSYLAMAASSQNDRGPRRIGETDSYADRKFPNELELPEIDQIFEGMSQYEDPREYSIDSSLLRFV